MAQKYFYDEAEVLAVPQPEFTNTWHPFSHQAVVHTLDKVVEAAGIGVKNKHYTLSKDGANCFSSWVLDSSGNGGRDQMIGFRNSINKSFALGFCAGAHITICSNMMFSGEFVEFRKHDSGLDDLMLKQMAGGAFNQVQKKMVEIETWHDKLTEYPMRSQRNFKALCWDAMSADIIPINKFNQFVDSYNEEIQVDPSRTLKTFHGSVTRLLRGNSLFSQSHRNGLLTGFCDDYMEALAA